MVKLSEYFLTTFKEDSGSSEIPSYSLSTRAGLIKKIAAGVYTFMPLGLRVLKKIEAIVREEMDKTGAIEILMPAMQPADLWMRSGRWYQYGPELFRLKDRNEREFCLGPTHEEIITYIAYQQIKSYKDMPVNLYQIQVKFRDEIRPRYGILRAREFIMKDAYSFSSNEKDLDDIYNNMYKCYSNILKRLNLKYFAVEADTGLIGGKYSHEFIILAKNGEDEIAYCPECGYSANFEMAKFSQKKTYNNSGVEHKSQLTEIHTPGITDIKSLAEYLKVPAGKIIKTMLLKDSEGNIYAFLVSGDRELNIAKAEKIIGKKLELVGEEAESLGLKIGFAGPTGLDTKIKIYADNNLKYEVNLIAGANKKDYHLKNVNCPDNFTADAWDDFVYPFEGDKCIECGNEIRFEKGIEIGHIFKLGTRYSEKLEAVFLDSEGKLKPVIMGCYGIGISRILSAVIEQLFDKKGILWPLSIAPFLVNLIAINVEDQAIAEASEVIYNRLNSEGIEVLYDDRNLRAGVKFKDSDLIGIPLKLIVGKNYLENKLLEVELRKDGSKFSLDIESAINFIKEYPQNNSFSNLISLP
ncbi:MAG: proline--tRNA ligase, partial [Actinobacteria bacterium]|nr:proline--tRNA ligase [Actinomycetota bacterium]